MENKIHPKFFPQIFPRSAVANPLLTRPNWLNDAPRNPDLLWLDKNENTDPQLLALARKVLGNLDPIHLTTYPEMASFYRKLAQCEDTDPYSLLLTAGSDGVIRTVFEAFISPGDVVLHTTPTFAMYSVYGMIFGSRSVTLEYEASAQGPLLKVEEVLAALERHRPRLFCLPNPDSPTGTVFTPDEMEAFISKAAEVGSIALIDEAYFPFYPHTVAALIDKYSNLVVARTFSKAWGLAGIRTGYAIACPELTQVLHKIRPMYEVNTVAIGYMEKMLEFKSEMLASVQRLNAGKEYFKKEMVSLGFPILNGEGNFTHVAFGSRQSALFKSLEDLVLFRKDFKERSLQGFSRFSTATREIFQPVVDRIRETTLVGGSK